MLNTVDGKNKKNKNLWKMKIIYKKQSKNVIRKVE